MRSIVISSGHGLKVRGAAGYLDEVNEARKVVDDVYTLLRDAGVQVQKFHDNTSTTQNQNLQTIVNFHNRQSRDLDVSVHFNAYRTTSSPMGVEVLYITQQALAAQLAKAIADAAGLINRGPKKRTDLYFLNNTNKPAILIETCFVDSSADANIYLNKFAEICNVIASITGDVMIPGTRPPDPVEPPIDPEIPLPPAEQAIVDITIKVTGNAVVNINGQDFQINPPDTQIWQMGIEATVFGGTSDPNNSAYPPYEFIGEDDVGVALPWKWPLADLRPKILVRNVANGEEVIADIVDLGPWMTDDPYWTTGARPVAETCCDGGVALPSGPNKGKVPTNRAGIDLTPAAARAIGIQGKGLIDWTFA